jgi:signal peptidase II
LKGRNVLLIIFLVVIADQVLKIYIKTNYHAGESHNVIGNWFRLYFIENEGMAYGWKFGGDWGKMILTLFRLAAVIFGVFYLKSIVKKKYHPGFIACAALIFAGALGNLIDSMFYGMIFEESNTGLQNVAKIFPEQGYAGFFHGKVVDMLYFPLFEGHYPSWVPRVGGQSFTFFEPVFNIADAAISVGVLVLLFFQKKLVHKKEPETEITT